MKNFKFNNKREGKYIKNYNSGNISIKCYYKNDKLEGEYIYLLQNYNKMKNFKLMENFMENILHIIKVVILSIKMT